MSTTEFIVLRHGETAWNAEGRIQGHLDSPLNEEGLAQALLVGDRVGHESFSQLYSSDLGRALQTAQPIADRSGRPVLPDARLRERNLGLFQGHTGEQCERRWPQHYARFRSRDPDQVIPAGESARQLYERVRDVFAALASEHMGERLVVVTHGGVLDALYRFVRGLPLEQPRDFPIYNASLNVVHLDGARWSIARWGDISHLTRDAALDDF
ncbi:MAG TPA: histidine phosphatase family protein [Burkholderiales bacterium]|nr:histidine phosphatase family protein [Burkholderiales bacterium]